MKPENKAILDAHRHYWELYKRQQTMTGVTQTVKNELLKVMQEEFAPGYTYDAWCSHCVLNFVKDVYQRYERWEAENVTPVQEVEIVREKAEFELPKLIITPIKEVLEKLTTYPTDALKRHYLDLQINNYNIDEALNMWDKDCEECVRQGHTNSPHWLGIFHAVHGEAANPFDQQKDPDKFKYYNEGQQLYNDYIQLCDLRDNLTSEMIKNTTPVEAEKIVIRATFPKHKSN